MWHIHIVNNYLCLQLANIQAAKTEISKTKEQLAEEKKIALSIRIQPLKVDVSTPTWSSSVNTDTVYMSRKIRKFRTDKFDTWNKRKFWLMQLM